MRHADWPAEVTPKEIADALGVSDKHLRQWLRENRSVGHRHYERWIFGPREADEIVAAFRQQRTPNSQS